MITTGDKSGFKVTIQRPGGDAFNEYDVKQAPKGNGQPSVTRCWLESEKDATFEIQCEIGVDAMNRNRPHDWTVTVCVDGRTVTHTTMSHTFTRASTVTVDCMTFMEGGVAYEGQLKFANLRTTDDDEAVTLSGAQLQALGTIRIDFCRGKIGKSLDQTSVGCIVEPDLGVASEKGKKLGGGIGYASKKLARMQTPVGWTDHDVETLPYHRLEFNYRLRPVLQLSGVVEDTTPPPGGSTRSEVLPRAPLAGPSRKRKAEVIDIDDEDTDSDQPEVKPDNKDRVKVRMSWLERQLAAANDLLKRRRIIPPGELVDLTGDD